MGIGISYAEMLVREHAHKPLRGRVLTIGRQTMWFPPETALDIVRATGIACNGVDPSQLATEKDTLNVATGAKCIKDNAFFSLLGIDDLQSLDWSDYEGASILHDLNSPLPKNLEGIADVIIDGSSLDNVWNPALALQSLTRMLRPGGRLFALNMGSDHFGPYTIFTPPWFFDYCVINNFVDCRVYAQISKPDGPYNVLTIDPATLASDPSSWARNLAGLDPSYQVGIYLFAEKGPNTTWDATPIQQFYQSGPIKDRFHRNLRHLNEKFRPHLLRSSTPAFVSVPAGYLMV
jgi:SAM-dependent methyltransferase